VEDTYGVDSEKLPPGHMVLYPATSLHRVAPITRGARVASFFWCRVWFAAMVIGHCSTIWIRRFNGLAVEAPGNAAGVQLTSVYHN
jgi:PKHD-type hydroxylase